MATTTIEPGNFYVTTGSVSGNTITHDSNKAVEIFSAKIDYDYLNQAPVRAIPLSGGSVGVDDPFAINVGLKLVVESLAVTGALVDDDTSSAFTKRGNLLSMAKNDKELTVVWGTGSERTLWTRDNENKKYGVTISKMRFRHMAGKFSTSSTNTSPNRKINVEFAAIRAKDLTSS